MKRQYYLDLAARNLRMPIGANLLLHMREDADRVRMDGRRLGKVIIETAERYQTPLAIPLMDLNVEKQALARVFDVPEAEVDLFYMTQSPTDQEIADVIAQMQSDPTPAMRANLDAIRAVAGDERLLPIGLAIGPFTLMIKLVEDPITAVYLAAVGETSEETTLVERVVEMSTQVVCASVEQQTLAGAKAIFICEPAACQAYISPIQMEGPGDVFDRFITEPNQRVRQTLRSLDADLMFHCCGEVTPEMVRRFGQLDPAMLSLGSSVRLWEAASAVPKDVVLYGNLPSKLFHSDEFMPIERVEALAQRLQLKMAEVGHPFILGSECDVLSIEGKHKTTTQHKVDAMMSCASHRSIEEAPYECAIYNE